MEPSLLTEHSPLTKLLNVLPRKAQKGLFQVDVEWTSIAANDLYIAVGTNIGTAFLYHRTNHTIERLSSKVKNEVVSYISMQSSVDDVVAMGTKSGLVYIYQLPSILPGRNKVLRMYAVSHSHHSPITSLEWSQNSMKLYSGDADGLVVCTEIDYTTEESKSYHVCKETHPIVQLSYAYKLLLVSTSFRSFLVVQENASGDFVQIGQKDRKSLGRYGACFLPGVGQAKDAVLYAARPGLRLWKANTKGVVDATYILKPTLHHGLFKNVLLLPDSVRQFCDSMPTDPHLGPLYIYQETLIFTYHGAACFLIDPGLGTILAHHRDTGTIVDVAVNGEEVFLLRKEQDRLIIRLAQSADFRLGLLSPQHEDNTHATHSGDSPIHVLSQTANKMSTSIVGALKNVGEKLQAVQEGQEEGKRQPPPWGFAGEKKGDSSSPDTDSAKEVSPDLSSPDAIASPVLAAAKDDSTHAPTGETNDASGNVLSDVQDPPGAPPIIRLENDDTITIKLDIPLGEAQSIGGPSLGGTGHSKNLLLDEGDIVFSSSSHRSRKGKKKKTKGGKEKDKDSVSLASFDSGQTSAEFASNSSPQIPLSSPQIPSQSPQVSSNSSLLESTQISLQTQDALPRSASSSPQPLSTDYKPEPEFGVDLESLKTQDENKDPEANKNSASEQQGKSNSVVETKDYIAESQGISDDSGHVSMGFDKSGVKSSENIKEESVSSLSSQTPESIHAEQSLPVPDEPASESQSEQQNTYVQSAMMVPELPSLNKDLDDVKKLQVFLNLENEPSESVNPPTVEETTHSDSPYFPNYHSTVKHDTLHSPSDESTEDFYSLYHSGSYGSAPTSPAGTNPEPSIADSLEYSGEGATLATNPMGKAKNPPPSPNDIISSEALKMADSWTEFVAPNNLQSFCVTDKHIWVVDKSERLFYSWLGGPGLKWKYCDCHAQQIAVSPTGWIVWRLHKRSLHVGTKITTRVPYGMKWVEVAREVAYIAVDNNVAWYAKENGDLMIQKGLSKDRPSFRSEKVKCPQHVHQVACYGGVVWVLTEDRNILVRVGIQHGVEQGIDWTFLQGMGPSLLPSSLCLGDQQTAWIFDVVGRLWFTTGVTQDKPQGSGRWWQVPLSAYLMQDSSAHSTLYTAMSSPTHNLSRLFGGDQGGLVRAGTNGIWVCPGLKNMLHVCRGSLIGGHSLMDVYEETIHFTLSAQYLLLYDFLL